MRIIKKHKYFQFEKLHFLINACTSILSAKRKCNDMKLLFSYTLAVQCTDKYCHY